MTRLLAALGLSGCVAPLPAPLPPVPVLVPSSDVGAREAREEQGAQTTRMARALGRAAVDAARRNDCDTVRRLEVSFLALPPSEDGKPYVDLFIIDPGVERCLGLVACRDIQTLLREQPELGDDARVKLSRAKCPPRSGRVKTRREQCLEMRSKALLDAQRIPDPKERGRALRLVMVCPPGDALTPSRK